MTDSLVDTSLGQYHLIELIGRGGMATVYKASQETLGRFVAIKVLSRQDDPEFAKRFKAEARATAYLQHPHILPIYDYGEQNGLFYLVLQYIENSKTLDDLTGEPMPTAQALVLVSRLLSALEYAHTRGVVHRDIKPANVLLPAPDWPMLTDFGIAKLLDETGQHLTATGLIVGTPAYIAPEQAMGHPVDARTDLYSTGVILYELLTGTLPFEADSAMAMLLKHVNEPPPSPRIFNPDLPEEVEPVLMRALAKRPEDRYSSAREMADALQQLLVHVEPGQVSSRIATLYQGALQAFESQRWSDAVVHLSQLQMIAPGYKDSADLLTAARIAQGRTAEQAAADADELRRSSPAATRMLPAVEAEADSASVVRTGADPSLVAVPPAPAVPTPQRSRTLWLGIAALAVLLLAGGGFFMFGQRTQNADAPVATAGVQVVNNTPVPPTVPAENVAIVPTGTAATNPQAAATAPAAPLAGVSGTLTWGNGVLRSDVVTVTVDALPPPPDGRVYGVWLSSDENSLALGNLSAGPDGRQTLSFASPTHEDLVSRFDRVFVTEVPASVANVEVANVILVGSIPKQALVHIRHVLVSFDTTPNKIGFGIGIIQEANEVFEHAKLLNDAMQANNFAGERIHTEHLVNIIEGQEGEHFGDLNGDGKTQNPGDGFGLLQNGGQNGYIEGAKAHALLGAEAQDGTPAMKEVAATVQVAADTVRDRVTTIRDLALKVDKARNAAATKDDVQTILKLAQAAVNGEDANGNGQVEPIASEGGALVVYQQAQQMAAMTIAAGTVEEAAAPLAAPTAATEAGTVVVKDNTFEARKITVVVGSTIVWNNAGPSAHTVSAEDKSFDSGTMSNGGTFSHTFDQPGTFPYFCQFHGGPHGEGMSGTVIVSAKP